MDQRISITHTTHAIHTQLYSVWCYPCFLLCLHRTQTSTDTFTATNYRIRKVGYCLTRIIFSGLFGQNIHDLLRITRTIANFLGRSTWLRVMRSLLYITCRYLMNCGVCDKLGIRYELLSCKVDMISWDVVSDRTCFCDIMSP